MTARVNEVLPLKFKSISSTTHGLKKLVSANLPALLTIPSFCPPAIEKLTFLMTGDMPGL